MGLSQISPSDAFLLSHRLDPKVTVAFRKGKTSDFLLCRCIVYFAVAYFFLMRTNWACPRICYKVLLGLAAARHGKKSTHTVKCLLI